MTTATERPPLTDRQRDILAFVVRYWGKHGVAPALREIGDQFDIASPNGVKCHLNALASKGYLHIAGYDDGRVSARGIVVPELLAGAQKVAAEYLEALS